MPRTTDANLLVGTDTHDDAGVYLVTPEIALVQTIDFFPPVVNDPFIYGQIAAANALSDIYAMGGVPKTALNLVGYPDDKDPSLKWLEEILRGGADRCVQAGCVVLGGHTVRDAEIKFGMAVTGFVHPQKILTNATAKPGDKLVLTKPLGTGFVTTAHKANDCPEETLRIACTSMITLNDVGSTLVREAGAHALTDVTGFGLAGHGLEMALGSNATLVLDLARLPLIPGAEALVRKNYRTRASKTNREYVQAELRTEGKIDPVRLEFFFDAQTSGGLLASVPADQADALVARLRESGLTYSAVIGEVQPRGATALVVR